MADKPAFKPIRRRATGGGVDVISRRGERILRWANNIPSFFENPLMDRAYRNMLANKTIVGEFGEIAVVRRGDFIDSVFASPAEVPVTKKATPEVVTDKLNFAIPVVSEAGGMIGIYYIPLSRIDEMNDPKAWKYKETSPCLGYFDYNERVNGVGVYKKIIPEEDFYIIESNNSSRETIRPLNAFPDNGTDIWDYNVEDVESSVERENLAQSFGECPNGYLPGTDGCGVYYSFDTESGIDKYSQTFYKDGDEEVPWWEWSYSNLPKYEGEQVLSGYEWRGPTKNIGSFGSVSEDTTQEHLIRYYFSGYTGYRSFGTSGGLRVLRKSHFSFPVDGRLKWGEVGKFVKREGTVDMSGYVFYNDVINKWSSYLTFYGIGGAMALLSQKTYFSSVKNEELIINVNYGVPVPREELEHYIYELYVDGTNLFRDDLFYPHEVKMIINDKMTESYSGILDDSEEVVLASMSVESKEERKGYKPEKFQFYLQYTSSEELFEPFYLFSFSRINKDDLADQGFCGYYNYLTRKAHKIQAEVTPGRTYGVFNGKRVHYKTPALIEFK